MLVSTLAQLVTTAATGIHVLVERIKRRIMLPMVQHQVVEPALLDIIAQRVLVARQHAVVIISTRHQVRQVVRL